MIRIDLGKNELGKAPSKSLGAIISKVRLPPKVKSFIQKIQISVSLVIITVASATLSALLPILANQYQITFVNQNQEVVREKRHKLAKIVEQVTRYSPFLRELKSYEDQKTVVNNRLTIVRQLLDNRAAPVSVLDTIGQSLPSRTWLSSIDLILGEQQTVTVVGQSYSNEEVSDFVDNLSKSIYLTSVNLEEVTTRSVDKIDYRGFQITMKSKPHSDILVIPPALPQGAPPDTRSLATAPATSAENAPGAKPFYPPLPAVTAGAK